MQESYKNLNIIKVDEDLVNKVAGRSFNSVVNIGANFAKIDLEITFFSEKTKSNHDLRYTNLLESAFK